MTWLRARRERRAVDVKGFFPWTVERLSPERVDCHSRTLEGALAWCPVYLMTDDLGPAPFAG